MTCENIKLEGGAVAIVCSRGKRWPTCAFCKTRNSATLLCDGPKANGKTCDAKVCRACATNVAKDRDLCPACVRPKGLAT